MHDTNAVSGAARPLDGAHSTQSVTPQSSEHVNRRLGPLLCWAVVFADIGTSVYYVPGILYRQVGTLAGLFVIMTLVVFLLLTLKYAEVSVRFPEGGGVVTVAARGLNPWAGAVGGMFILVDYFLTAAISSLSGVQYLQSLVPALSPAIVQLLITLMVLALLGILNWYGIKESATVSLYIAAAALVIDLLIILTVLITVPLPTIGLAFHEMFSGQHLTGGLILTGFAGAFLAFSGLESISQLSPVMRAPRKRTVSWALALVVLTVGITSPLLTIFSTTLLHAKNIDPNTFISALGGFSGGRPLEILTALTASTLLIFAANTAIIGAYHVFLALSRMHFFPHVIEKTNKFRGTPHVSILLATGIPAAVLVIVGGRIDVLGDMYAFGLLGAFSLTCLALDVIRWRERHTGERIGDTGDEEMREAAARRNMQSLPALRYLSDRVDPMTMERLWHLRRRVSQQRRVATAPLKRMWPNVRYYIGFVTTALVLIAWSVNLFSKPAATIFGGGLTLVGVGISVVNYRYQRAKGNTPPFLMPGLKRMPDALLVLLSPRSQHNVEVIRAAVGAADGRTLVFLYLAHAPVTRELRAFQIEDPYGNDAEAKSIFSLAAAIAREAGVRAEFLYRVGGPGVVSDIWRTLRPSEIVGEASLSKILAMRVAPEYVRYQTIDGVRVAHYVKHFAAATGQPTTAGAANAGTTPQSIADGESDTMPNGMQQNGRAPSNRRAPPAKTTPERAAREDAAPVTPPVDANGQAGVNLDDYVWTGTQLVRRSESTTNPAEEQTEDTAKGAEADKPNPTPREPA